MSPRQRLRLRNLFSLLLLSHLQFCFGSSLTTQHLPPPTLPFPTGLSFQPGEVGGTTTRAKGLLKKRQPELLRNGKLTGMLSSEKPRPRYRGSKNLSRPVLVDRAPNFTHHSGIYSRQHYRFNHRTAESGSTIYYKPWPMGSHKGKISDIVIFTTDTFGGRSLNRCTNSSCTLCSC